MLNLFTYLLNKTKYVAISFLLIGCLFTVSSNTFAQDNGETTQEPVEASIQKTQDASKQQLAEQILNKLRADNNLPDKITEIIVVDSPEINAATNGKEIYFYEGLWDKLPTDDQKAFVISHEMGHVYANHVYKGAGRRAGLSILGRLLPGLFGGGSAVTNTIVQTVTNGGLLLTDLKFSRRAEHQADRLGLDYMTTSGYNPQGATETLTVLKNSSQSTTPQFLRSHPMSENRIKALVKEQEKKQQTATNANEPK